MSTFFNQANAQKISLEQAKPYLEAFQKSIEIPKEYQFHSVENLWIEPHNEEIIVNGKSLSINGMKYKCFRPSHNDYAWVIVGSDGTIITFERDIFWDNHKQKCITEKWLHDNWRIEK
ncbi:hypothetical protein AB4865_05165 [Capnocytophaga sp. ARDL2]|uniref:hypothetical protein n=1 Tax=Capnocytophaga sp. ARDL2 TaxID=3238809 RepID=UPI0035571D0E